MNVLLVLKIIATLAMAVTGLLALIKPDVTYGFIGLTAKGRAQASQIRSIFGGLFIALGNAAVVSGSVACQMLDIHTWRLPQRGHSQLYLKNPMHNRISSAWSLKSFGARSLSSNEACVPVRIVTNSSCDLPAETIIRYGVYVIPLFINVGVLGFRDG